MTTPRAPLALTPHGLPGRLVVVCGLDGTGKSTVCRAVAARLWEHGLDVIETGQPTRMLREIPLFQQYRYQPANRGSEIDHRAVICLFLGDRLQHAHETIVPALAAGKTVVCHRYIYNLLTEARAIDVHDQWIAEACGLLPEPDSAVILDADLQTIVERVGSRTDPRSGFVDRRPHLERVLQEYRQLAEELEVELLSSSVLPVDAMVERAWDVVSEELGLRTPSRKAAAGGSRR